MKLTQTVSIIGPVAPFASGIARHTTALARALRDRGDAEVRICSFRRQYPRVLYPGGNERDPSLSPPAGISTRFEIDALNPFTWRRAAARIAADRPALAVIPAWTFFLAPCLGTIARRLRSSGVEVVMVVHNVSDHEAVWWKSRFSRYQLAKASRFLTHTDAMAADLKAMGLTAPVAVMPHPVYDDYPPAEEALERAAALELLFFGVVRPYKGLDIALRALAGASIEGVRLTVAGEFWEGLAETRSLIEELGISSRVRLIPRRVEDAEVAALFQGCDAVVAPYRSATGSGVVALAQQFCKPVVASDVAGLAGSVEHRRTGWLFPAGDAKRLAALLTTEVTAASAAAMRPALEAQKEGLSWARFTDVLLAR